MKMSTLMQDNSCKKSKTVSMEDREIICVICKRNFQPNRRLKRSKRIQRIFSVCSDLLKPEVFISAKWELLTEQEKISPFCSSCFSSGRKLSLLNDRMKELKMQIKCAVNQFTKAILGYQNTCDDSAVNNLYESFSFDEAYNENDLICEIDIKDEIMDMKLDFDLLNEANSDTVTEPHEMKANYNAEAKSDILVSTTKRRGRTSTVSPKIQLKNLFVKLEKLQFDCEGKPVLMLDVKKRCKRKRAAKAFASKSTKGIDTIFEDGFACNEDDNFSSTAESKTKRIRLTGRCSDVEVVAADQKKFKCVVCGISYCSKGAYKSHLKRHSEAPLKCNKCEQVFFSQSARKTHCQAMHIKTVEAKSHLICKICQESFVSVYDKEIHLLAHNNEIPFVCNVCQEQFSNIRLYLKHQRLSPCPINDSIQVVNCDLCDKTFKTKFQLLVHTSDHNKVKAGYNCAVCGKFFKKNYELIKHTITHTDETPYSCDICQMPARSVEGLGGHRNSHKGSNSLMFQCKHCPLMFSTKFRRGRHAIVAHNSSGKIFTCETCGWEFQIKDDFKRHIATHSKSIICDICGKAYNRTVDLKTHKRIHTGDMFSCATCEKQFVSPYLLSQHIASVHGVRNDVLTDGRVKNRIRDKKKKMKTKTPQIIDQAIVETVSAQQDEGNLNEQNNFTDIILS